MKRSTCALHFGPKTVPLISPIKWLANRLETIVLCMESNTTNRIYPVLWGNARYWRRWRSSRCTAQAHEISNILSEMKEQVKNVSFYCFLCYINRIWIDCWKVGNTKLIKNEKVSLVNFSNQMSQASIISGIDTSSELYYVIII